MVRVPTTIKFLLFIDIHPAIEALFVASGTPRYIH